MADRDRSAYCRRAFPVTSHVSLSFSSTSNVRRSGDQIYYQIIVTFSMEEGAIA